MLESFRRFGESPATKWLLGLLIVSFLVWGIQDYMGGSSGGAALTIDGRDVPLSEVDTVHRTRIQTLAQMLGAPPTSQQLAQLNVPNMVLTELINRHTLNAATQTLQLKPAETVLLAEISNTQAFHTEGRFDADRYRRLLANQGLTPRTYETMLSEQMAVAMLSDILTLPTPPTAAVLPLLQQAQTSTTVEIFTLSAASAGAIAQPTPDELQAFYAQNATAYMVPEKRSFRVLSLSPDAMAPTITITDDQLTEHYQTHQAMYISPETRHVRHILLKDRAKAVELFNQATSHEVFIQLANTHTEDPSGKTNGGDLGTIKPDDVVPDFAKVAFDSEAGKPAGPVQTPFGWHVLWIDAIYPEAQQPFETVKERIRTDLLQEQLADAAQTLMRTIDDRAAAGDDLETIAKAVGIPTTAHGLLNPTSNAVESTLIRAAFEAPQGAVEGPLSLADGSLAYLETTAVVPSNVPALDSIQTRVADDFRQARIQTKLTEQANLIAKSVPSNPGQTLETIAQAGGLQGIASTLTFATVSDAPAWLHTHLTTIAQLPVGAALNQAVSHEGQPAVLRVTGRTMPTLSQPQAEAAAATFRARLQNDLEALLIRHLVANAKITYNTRQLRQIFGPEWSPPK